MPGKHHLIIAGHAAEEFPALTRQGFSIESVCWLQAGGRTSRWSWEREEKEEEKLKAKCNI